MDRKAIFFDIDGTLLDKKMIVEPSTKEAFRLLRQAGHYTFLCSGRSRGYIFNPELLGLGFDGIVAACGTDVEAFDKMLVSYHLAPEKLARYYKLCHENYVGSLWEGREKILVDDTILKGNQYYEFLKKQLGPRMIDIVGNEDEWKINKMIVTFDERSDDSILEEIGKDFQVLRHAYQVAELVPNGYTKATGMQAVVSELGIDPDHVYAIGDSINDLEMLRYAGHSIAMGNGVDAVKDVAEYVTTDIHEDGIYNAMKYYGLIL
ncbi:MAG: HAD family hydrolase [Eubacterium sp.]|nr:HAD family hydrolase [Eubacterium sp.]